MFGHSRSRKMVRHFDVVSLRSFIRHPSWERPFDCRGSIQIVMSTMPRPGKQASSRGQNGTTILDGPGCSHGRDDSVAGGGAEPRFGGAVGSPAGRAGWQARLDRVVYLLLCCRVGILLGIHVSVFSTVFLLSYIIRFDGVVPAIHWETAIAFLPVLVLLKLASFVIQGRYRGWYRYNTFDDMVGMACSATLGSLAVVLAASLIDLGQAIPLGPRHRLGRHDADDRRPARGFVSLASSTSRMATRRRTGPR